MTVVGTSPAAATPRRARAAEILGVAVLALAATLLVSFGPAQDAANPYGAALRYTARLAAVFFLLAFTASSLARLAPRARPLVRQRRYLGLAFALVHGAHGVLIALWMRQPEVVSDAATLVGGGLAYGFALLLAITSNDASVRALGSWWGRLHRTGSWYIWLIFAFTFAGSGLQASWSALFALAFVAAAALRLSARRSSTRSAESRSGATGASAP